LGELVTEGKIEWQSVADVCDVVAGRAPARMSAEEIIVFKAISRRLRRQRICRLDLCAAAANSLRQEWNFH
jgi:hypothetical protein